MKTVIKFREPVAEEDLKEGRKIYNEIISAATGVEKEDLYEAFYLWKEYVMNNYSTEEYYELCRKARGM